MRQRNVLLVYPRFADNSFWNYRETCEAVGRRCPAPPLGLITMAALLPAAWTLRLVDCNAEPLTDADLAWADLVMTGGMFVQQRDTLDIIGRCRAARVPAVVGGPDATSSPHVYASADFQVLGEVEPVMADFVAAVDGGATAGRFEAIRYTTDVTTSPVPRFDLINLDHYLQMSVQFSRGCPFACEFCDIIELYGRNPRTKTPRQVLDELDALEALGWRGSVFVDDNLIGNKKAVKAFLPILADWLQARDYPFEFTTEASINLADDAELLALMRTANFFALFVGIESADAQTLAATRKKQNTGRDLAESVQRIYAAGMFVVAGFIVGFDAERGPVAPGSAALIEAAAIPICMIGLLWALPNTQLSRRLEREGRLAAGYEVNLAGAGDHCTTQGLNFVTLRPRRDILADCRDLIRETYRPERYFGRLRRMARRLDARAYRAAIPLRRDLYEVLRLTWRCVMVEREMRGEVWRTVVDCLRHNPRALRSALRITSLYLHFGPFARRVVAELDDRIARERADEPRAPAVSLGVSSPRGAG